MKKILAYGTLREGQYNFDRIKSTFGEHSIKRVESLSIEGYDMYNMGPFPCVTKGGGKIQVEMLELSDNAADAIERMELGAGYEPIMIGEAKMYIYSDVEGYDKIESGDWIKESTENENN